MSNLSQILKGKRPFYLILLFSLTCLIPYLLASLYVHPQYDDWLFAGQLSEFGRLEFYKYFYQNWSGRYFANFWLALFKADPMSTLYVYRLVAILFIILTFSGIHLLFRFLLKRSLSKVSILALSSLFTAFYTVNLTEVFSAFYWHCSSYYLLMNFFFLLLIISLFRYFNSDTPSTFKLIIATFLSFLICGFSEVHILSLFVLYSGALTYHLIENKKLRKDIIILLLVTMIGGYLNIFSPGTMVRMGVSDSDSSFLFSAIRAAYDLTILQIIPTLFSSFIIFPIILLLISETVRVKLDSFKNIFSTKPIYTLLLIILAFYLHHAASYYGAGYTLLGRVLNITNLLFYLSILYLTINCIFYYKISLNLIRYKEFYLGGLLILSLLLNLSPNSRIVVKEALFDLPQYDKELRARIDILKEGVESDLDVIELPRVTVNPKLHHMGGYKPDFNRQNSETIFKEMGIYFGKEIKIINDDYDYP